MKNALQKRQPESQAGDFTRQRALTELAGCAGFPAELLDPSIEGHLFASAPLLAEVFELELGSSLWQQFGVHPDV